MIVPSRPSASAIKITSVGITRSFSGFSQASDEASASRIFAGQHFRSDEEAGQTLGGRVADFVVDHAFLTRTHGR